MLGDAAHAITPHLGKGSNLAIQDAWALACASAGAGSVAEMLAAYSDARAPECAQTLLYSRHQGRLRNGLLVGEGGGGELERPRSAEEFEARVKSAELPTRMLPAHPAFAPLWEGHHLIDR